MFIFSNIHKFNPSDQKLNIVDFGNLKTSSSKKGNYKALRDIVEYFNELNTEAHYCTTGPEIWEQTEGKITHLVACSGTGGTISGTARFLKEQKI